MINDDLPSGATPLTPDDANKLIPKGVSTRGQLDQFESRNIQTALTWAFQKTLTPVDVLNISFCLNLHKRMFNKTWRWAGQIRQYEVNIGNTPPAIIQVQLKNLCDDALAWIEFETYPVEEISIRLHHRMVYIHPFPNGNGRHSRIMTDLLLKSLGQKVNLMRQTRIRSEYIEALRSADNGSYNALLQFAKN